MQHVDVDHPRPPAPLPHPAERRLDGEAGFEERVRAQLVSTPIAAFRNQSWSVSPQGGVR